MAYLMQQSQPKEECVYNLIPKGGSKPSYNNESNGHVKSQGHGKSGKQLNATDQVSIERGTKYAHRTMGPAEYQVCTDEFLKKHSKEPVLPEVSKFTRNTEHMKPCIPGRNEAPLAGVKTNKDFVKSNAVENIMSVVKQPAANFVDTRHGDTFPLDASGLQPKFVNKKEYGEIPVYLNKRKEEMQMAQQEYDGYIQDNFRRGAMKRLTREEWTSILDGLKQNWEDVHQQYQGLSVVTDTGPKKAKKERMEVEMKQLEKDIEMIERHPIIYIAN